MSDQIQTVPADERADVDLTGQLGRVTAGEHSGEVGSIVLVTDETAVLSPMHTGERFEASLREIEVRA